MKLVDLFIACQRAVVWLNTDGRTVYAGPPASITPAIVDGLRANKADLLSLPRIPIDGRQYFIVDLGNGAGVFGDPPVTKARVLDILLADGWPAIDGLAAGEEDWRILLELNGGERTLHEILDKVGDVEAARWAAGKGRAA